MKLPRRQFLHLAAGAAALPTVSLLARAQTYPARPVRIIVPYPPGGANDITARLIGQWLSERLGQPFVIENRPGATGNIGTEAVVRAPADGYALLMVSIPHAINATFYGKLNFNFIRDITPIASICTGPFVMEVNPSIPAKTIPEFIAYAMANPGKINVASPGNGTGSHLSGELFKIMTSIDMVHVPYRGDAPALTDLIGGQVQVMFGNMPSSVEHIRAGRLRPLAVTTVTRWDDLPEIPTVGEFVPGFEVSTWFGVGTPRNTPAEIVNKVNQEINAALNDRRIRARLSDLGAVPFVNTPNSLAAFVAAETEKWGKVIRAAKIKAE